jgi:hypothetical protein
MTLLEVLSLERDGLLHASSYVKEYSLRNNLVACSVWMKAHGSLENER